MPCDQIEMMNQTELIGNMTERLEYKILARTLSSPSPDKTRVQWGVEALDVQGEVRASRTPKLQK